MITSNSQIIPHCEIEEFIKVDMLHFLRKNPTAKQADNSFNNKFTEILLTYKNVGEEPIYSFSPGHTFHV